MTKSKMLSVKVSEDEETQIIDKAHQYGGNMSQYIRHCLLESNAPLSGLQNQEIAHILCRHAKLIVQIDDSELRNALEELEGKLWHFIK